MAARSRVTQTTFAGLRRQAVSNAYVVDSWHQIVGHLSAVGKDNAAALFAEPVVGQTGQVSWFAEGTGTATPLENLPDDDRAAVMARFEAAYGEVEAEADRLLAQKKASDIRLGQMLKKALDFPSDGTGGPAVWSIDGRPLLVNWGARSDMAPANLNPLRDYVRRAAVPVAPARTIAPAAGGAAVAIGTHVPWLTWLLWLVFAALVSWVFVLLLGACDVARITGLRFCPSPVVAAGPADRTAQLEATLLALESQAGNAPLCEAAALAPDPVAQDAVPDDEIERRRQEAGAGTGDVTITLSWDSRTDLDLQLVCPGGGAVVNYERAVACGAELDIDQNAVEGMLQLDPIENIILSPSAPPGRYRVRVNRYDQRWNEAGPTPFTLRISREGSTEEHRGRVSRNGETVDVIEFDYP